MFALFTDTTFGFLMRNISGGRLFKYEDQYNEELREEYFNSGEVKEEEASAPSGIPNNHGRVW